MHWFPLRPPDFLSKRIRRVSEFSDSREQSKTNIRLYYIPLRAARERKIVFVYSSRRPPRSTAAAFFFFFPQNSKFRFCFRAGVVSEEWHQLSGEGKEVRGEGEDVMKLFRPAAVCQRWHLPVWHRLFLHFSCVSRAEIFFLTVLWIQCRVKAALASTQSAEGQTRSWSLLQLWIVVYWASACLRTQQCTCNVLLQVQSEASLLWLFGFVGTI